VVWRWEQRANLRLLRDQLLSSVAGRFMLLTALVSLHPLWRLLTRGVLAPLPLSPAAENGALVLAHLLAAAYCGLATVSYYVVILHRRAERDPLRAHGGLAPLRLLYRAVVGVIGFVVPVVVVMMAVVYGDILTERPGGGARLAGFAAGGALLFSGLALLVFLASTRTPPRRLIRGGIGVLRLLAVGMFILSLAIVFVPVALAKRQPAVLEAVGSMAERFSWGLQLPLLLALPAEGPPIVPFVLALAPVALALWRGSIGLRRWSEAGLPASAGDLDGERHHASGLTGIGRAAPGSRVYRLFWAKDIVLPYRRSPGSYVQEQWVLLGSATVLIVLAIRTLKDTLAEGVLLAAAGFLPLMCVAALAGGRGLGSLGSEGRQVHRLHSVLTAGLLFRVKACVNAGFVTAHAVLYGYLLAALAAALGNGPSRGGWGVHAAGGLAAGAGAAFATLATGIGFLVPDFTSKFRLLPGATRVGLVAYLSVATGFSGLLSLAWASWVLGRLGTGAAVANWGGALLIVTALGWLLARWGHARLRRMEW
jgi:hypothetical protein